VRIVNVLDYFVKSPLKISALGVVLAQFKRAFISVGGGFELIHPPQ
jgi:hypothetical protein